MSEVTKYDPVSPLTDLLEWLQSGWPAVAEWRREAAHTLRIEVLLEDDRPVVCAEIPGVAPDKDVQVTVSDGVLTISAERREQTREKGARNFATARSCAGCPCRQARRRRSSPRYDDGILEVTVPIAAVEVEPRTIPVAHGSGA